MATISISLPKFCTAERSTLRPMRPKPLIPTLIDIAQNSCVRATRGRVDGTAILAGSGVALSRLLWLGEEGSRTPPGGYCSLAFRRAELAPLLGAMATGYDQPSKLG